MIFNLSRGLTTVREAAPATPPATKYERTSGLAYAKRLYFIGCFDSGSACGGPATTSACEVRPSSRWCSACFGAVLSIACCCELSGEIDCERDDEDEEEVEDLRASYVLFMYWGIGEEEERQIKRWRAGCGWLSVRETIVTAVSPKTEIKRSGHVLEYYDPAMAVRCPPHRLERTVSTVGEQMNIARSVILQLMVPVYSWDVYTYESALSVRSKFGGPPHASGMCVLVILVY